jgi:taurine dioxygenase
VAIIINRVGGGIGADISGIDLSRPLDEDTRDMLMRALADHGVVFLPAPERGGVDVHRQLALSLGEIAVPHAALASLKDDGAPDVGVISTTIGNAYAANCWHSDVTWKPAPSRYSILHMQVCPQAGGDTMWSSQIVAFAALSPPMQRFLEGLTAHHRISAGIDGMEADHPVVIRHPLTGAKSLFVNGLFTDRINELSPEESDQVLGLLQRHATKPDFTCRKRWTPGEIGIWDNHFVQHYAIVDYDRDAERVIHRIEVAGEAPVAAVA